MCRWRDGKYHPAKVIERRKMLSGEPNDYEYYIHYTDSQKQGLCHPVTMPTAENPLLGRSPPPLLQPPPTSLPAIKTFTQLVTGLVTVINGYLMLEFFSAEARGLVFSCIFSAFDAAYILFIIYLILGSITFSYRFSST